MAWSAIILGAGLAWPIGLWLGRVVGARYVVAWFFAWLGAGGTFLAVICVMEADRLNFEQLLRELRGGPLPGSAWIGVLVALGVSFLLTFLDIIATVRKRELAGTSGEQRPLQFTIRTLLVVMIVVSIVGSAFQVTWAPFLRCKRGYQRVSVTVESLAGRCPSGIAQQQWDNYVGWTQNAVGNCLTSPSYIRDEPRLHRFADELEKKLQGDVDVSTIDWIWDEIEQISTHGESYSEKFRPTRR